ncbi:MAG TPA: FoF1 ATP synthase subunit gamma [Aromatoleum sp.]|uniref:F0F1 ATP synthase subunit gamma n=1 Tax=Aromatoleum sp. TaxID=2307007 RepID=UPI002B48B3B3|nr:FoF1 ATP synthase subunit gamma [Aromatoleum sp.]HJV26199.1 FoF1 ATP synthase subunit gamma [Aromatoleum sp.]
MSRRRELSRRLGALAEISGIMSAMRGLALMETHVLQEFLPTQRRMVSRIEAAAADFLAWHPELLSAAKPNSEICILVGSEQGFCGDFNEALLRYREAHCRDKVVPGHFLTLGHRLASRLDGDTSLALLQLPGASVADEVPTVLLRLTRELNRLLATGEMAGCGLSVLYHCDATGDIRLRHLLPLRDLPAPVARPYPPEINLPAEDLLTALTGHYLYAALNEVLYSSLMAESRQRHAHMDRALKKLDEESEQLQQAYNAQRQEDITEEIEVILLSAGMLEDEC